MPFIIFVVKYWLDFVCIAEPWVSIDKIPLNFWRSLGLTHIASNIRDNKIPNIWLFASNSLDQLTVIDADA